MTEQEHDPFWTHDVELGEETFYRDSLHTIRLKLHRSTERYSKYHDYDEIVPLDTKRGERLYFLAKPYILVPDIRLTMRAYPTPDPSGAVGEVESSWWEGMKHDELGSAQAWYYLPDRILVLWEMILFDRHRRHSDPGKDSNYAAVWQGFERVLREHCPDAELLATPFDDPNYERDQYQDFLRSQGYSPIAQAAFGKTIEQGPLP